MRLLKLIAALFKFLYPSSNPFPGKRFLLPFLLLGLAVAMLFSYQINFIDEQIEFLSYSPTPAIPGKLYSLAYFSALSGDVDLGRYFYDLSISNGVDEVESNDKLIYLIYPERELVQKSVETDRLLTYFPTSRDLQILKAQLAMELENNKGFGESVDKLLLLDPNNPLVLGLEKVKE